MTKNEWPFISASTSSRVGGGGTGGDPGTPLNSPAVTNAIEGRARLSSAGEGGQISAGEGGQTSAGEGGQISAGEGGR